MGNDQKSFSIILLLYNNTIRTIELTLKSILEQEFKDYEIIVANDNPNMNYDIDIKKIMLKYQFSDYYIINNFENLGTVNNLINAFKIAKGKYFKAFGAGDLFFDQTSLRKVFDFLQGSDYKIAFGKIESYKFLETGEYVKSPFQAPILKGAFRKDDLQLTCKRVIYWNDLIWGISMFGERSFVLDYLNRIAGRVRIIEDIFQYMVILDGEKIGYLEEKIVFYEMQSGISTRKRHLLKTKKAYYSDDWVAFLKMIADEYKIPKLTKYCKRKIYVLQQEKTVYRFALYMITLPIAFLIQCIRNLLMKMVSGPITAGFLADKQFISDIKSR